MTLAYEDGTIDRAYGLSESPAALDRPGERSPGSGPRLLAGCAGGHADLLPILFVDRAVGAALRLLRLSGVGVPGVLRRHPAGRRSRHDGATARRFGARDRTLFPNRWSPRLNASSGPSAPALSSISICWPRRRRSAPRPSSIWRSSRPDGSDPGRYWLALNFPAQPFEIAIAHAHLAEVIVWSQGHIPYCRPNCPWPARTCSSIASRSRRPAYWSWSRSAT